MHPNKPLFLNSVKVSAIAQSQINAVLLTARNRNTHVSAGSLAKHLDQWPEGFKCCDNKRTADRPKHSELKGSMAHVEVLGGLSG